MSEDEIREFLPIFLDEANEQLEILERGFLRLEHESDPELLQELFRAAHTVKGSSAAMGFAAMKALVHALEDVLDRLRNKQLAVSREMIDTFFQGQDALKAMLGEVAASGQTTLDTTALTARIRGVLESTPQNGTTAAPSKEAAQKADESTPAALNTKAASRVVLTAEQQAALNDALLGGCHIFGIRVHIAPDCAMKSVRALMVLQTLERAGSVLAVYPDEEALENETFDFDFDIVFATEQTAEMVQIQAQSLAEIQGAEVTPWPAAAANKPEDRRPPMPLTETQWAAVQDALNAACELYEVTVQTAPDCVMKSVRALMVLQAMERAGSVLAVYPDEEALENEAFDLEFTVLVATEQSAETIAKTARSVTEITGAHVQTWAAERNMPLPAAPPAPGGGEKPPVQAAPEKTVSVETQAVVEMPAAPAPGTEKKAAAPVTQSQTVRVDVTRLDKLLNLVGELVIDRTRIAQLGMRFERQYGLNELIEHLNETSAHVGRITDELQEEIMKARMLPIDSVFSRFPRMMRDLAQKLDKELDFIIEGKDTELDRSVIEVIGDPLIHMLRNSIDHGLETPEVREKAGKPRTGTVWLRARHEENHIVIEIEDDGKGMDPEKLRGIAVGKGIMTAEAAARLTDKEALALIFASGFSTAAQVTEVSGRGVGMDIVRSNLQKLGAQIDIDSKVGRGSRFTIKLPLTLAIIRGLLVSVQDNVYALPLSTVVETLKVPTDSLHRVNHREVIMQRGKTLPIVRMSEIFRLSQRTPPVERTRKKERRTKAIMRETPTEGFAVVGPTPAAVAPDSLYMVVVGLAEKQVGLVVDRLIGEQEVVIKTLGKFIGDVRGISGATILGDGRVALIADINGIVHLAQEEKGKTHAA